MYLLPKFKQSKTVHTAALLLLFYFFTYSGTFAQYDLKIGQWRAHLPYQLAQHLAQSPTKIFATTESSIYMIDKQSDEVEFLSKVEGLSDVEVKFLHYDPFNEKLIATYYNGNIDLIDEQSIVNLPFILASQGGGDKQVYDVFVESQTATYLAMGFGLKILNVKEQEFSEETRADIRFNSVVVFQNVIYAATEEGIYTFDKSTGGNLQDFNDWSLLGIEEGFPEGENFQKLILFKDKLYFSTAQKIYRYHPNDTPAVQIAFEDPEGSYIKYMSAEGQRLIVGLKCCIPTPNCNCNPSCQENCDSKVVFLDENNDYLLNGSKCTNRSKFALEDESGNIWYADEWRKLRKADGYTASCSTFYTFNSPLTPAATEIAIDDGMVWVASEFQSLDPKIVGDGAFSFIDGEWTNYRNQNDPPLQNLSGFVTIAINPVNKKVYLGTVDDGLVEMVPDDASGNTKYRATIRYNDSNSTLQPSDDPNRIRVTGLAFDDAENLWVINHSTEKPLSVLKKDGTWYNDFLNIPFKDVRFLVVDHLGYKWFSIDGTSQALVVYDDAGTIEDKSDDRIRTFNSVNSELTSNFVFSIQVDLDGDVWVGTTEGIVIFECGASVFDESCRGARRIVNVDGFNAYLLETEEVIEIAVDGANRKWVGTGSGLFVFSPSGEEQVAFFDKSNSPLFHNQINAIAIDDKTGEVFIGTPKGLLSYRSDATAGTIPKLSKVEVFPNPVRPEYKGPIAIRGLARDANVKITDINGQLVYETKALGGQAIWDGRDYQGRKAASGVYLVLSTYTQSLDNTEAVVGKILFLK